MWVWLPFRFVSCFVSFLDFLAPTNLNVAMFQLLICNLHQLIFNVPDENCDMAVELYNAIMNMSGPGESSSNLVHPLIMHNA